MFIGSYVDLGAMDTKILESLFWEGVPVFDMGSNLNTIDVGWGTPTFHKMGREKAILVDHILSMGFEILMCDTDMVWMKVKTLVCYYYQTFVTDLMRLDVGYCLHRLFMYLLIFS